MSVIGFKTETTFENKKENNVIPPVDFQHVLCEGATGSGKTVSFILPTLEDRIKKGHAVIFFDHKGHEHKKVKYLAKKAGRLDDVVEIGKPHGSYINLMSELDTIRLKDMIKNSGMNRDPYWSNSAANLLEDIVSPLRRLYMIVTALQSFSGFNDKLLNILQNLTTYGINIYEKPSFHSIAKIISSPKKMLQFKEIVFTLSDSLEEMLVDNDRYVQLEGVKLRPIFAQILTLQKTLKDSDRFTLSQDKSDTNSGNNAVLQHLDNTIASYAKKDYVNTNEYSIDTLMQKNAIIIVDTQSFGEDVMKIFLESILKKAVMRLRTGSTTPLSVFIDEANRVLSPDIDLHNDVLREASVELILAIQNEEQMINKFSKTVWDSIKLNIKHQYMIDIEHRIFYNEGEFMLTDPMQFEDEVLIDAECSYYQVVKNQKNIQKYFLAESDTLPEKFTVEYDLDMFEHESAVFLEDREGTKYLYTYHGEEIVSKMRSFYVIETEIPSAAAFAKDVEDYSEMTLLEELGLCYSEVEKESEKNEEYCYDYDDDYEF